MKKFISQADMRIANLFEVLSIIRKEKSVTRKEIQLRTGLSWGGVSQISSRLLEIGYVVERKKEEPSVSGRTPFVLEINETDNYIIGIDINISGLYAAVINLCDDIVYSEEMQADASSRDAFLNSVYALLDSVTGRFSKSNIIAVGVAMQGSVDKENGISEKLGVKDWKNVRIKSLISERYSLPVYISHDPDCLLFAETVENKEDAVLIRIDDGIGMAVMKNGAIISGKGMLEIGHTVIQRNDEKSKISMLSSVLKGEKTPEYFDEISFYLAYAISNMLILFNAEKLLVCGNIMEYKDMFWDSLTENIHNILREQSIKIDEYDVKKAAYGAALLAAKEHLEYIK